MSHNGPLYNQAQLQQGMQQTTQNINQSVGNIQGMPLNQNSSSISGNYVYTLPSGIIPPGYANYGINGLWSSPKYSYDEMQLCVLGDEVEVNLAGNVMTGIFDGLNTRPDPLPDYVYIKIGTNRVSLGLHSITKVIKLDAFKDSAFYQLAHPKEEYEVRVGYTTSGLFSLTGNNLSAHTTITGLVSNLIP